MAAQLFYRPARDDQLKTSYKTRAFNCGACATRVLIRRYSLGSLNPTIEGIRKGAGNPSSWFTAYDVAEALRYFGVTVHAIYDRRDAYKLDSFANWLKAGNYGVALGDYEKVPNSLSGDPRFDGNHFVMLNQWQLPGPLLYDPVADGRRTGIPTSPVTWPWAVLRDYLHNLSDKFDTDITVILVRRRTVARKVPVVKVYAAPDPATAFADWKTGPLEYGALVRGLAISDPPNPNWYRVWWPYTARIGFVSQAHVTVNS